MCLSPACRLTCQGHFLSGTSDPPTILRPLAGWLTKEKGWEVKLESPFPPLPTAGPWTPISVQTQASSPTFQDRV